MITHIVDMLNNIKGLYGDDLRRYRTAHLKTLSEFAAEHNMTAEELEKLESVQDHAIYPLD